jgi:hypothetical protein
MTEEELYYVGGIIHERRMKECYGNWSMESRTHWPTTFKEYRRQQQAGQPWIDIAVAQAKALEPLLTFPLVGFISEKDLKE